MIFTTGIKIEIAVCKGNRPKSIFCVILNDGVDLCSRIIIKGNNLGLFVCVVLAAFKDHLRGTLNHKPLSISIILMAVASNSRHSLSV